MRFSSLLPVVLSLSLAFSISTASAQPAGTVNDNFIYLVESGDTLSDIAELYTTRSTLWRQLQQLNHVEDETRLPIGKELKIPLRLIPVVAIEAKLVHSRGQVQVNGASALTNYKLQTGDTITTGSTGFATLLLEDQSTLTLPPNSQLHIKNLNAFERARLSDAILELQSGSIETRVAPENTGVGRFEIHTPISITGVRGTNLRVHADSVQSRTELLTGKAHIDTDSEKLKPLQKGYGVNINMDGSSLVVPLLPAPQLSTPEQGRQGWYTEITPIEKASFYIIQVSLSADGSQPVQRYTAPHNTTTLPLRASGPGEHYVYVRAVDENGLMGLDAHVSFPGRAILSATDGSAILSSDGQAVFLNEY